ncbi:MAG: alpha-L-fucosidase [Ginsengibacter sp.]
MNYFKHTFSRRDLFRLGTLVGAGALFPRVLHANEFHRTEVVVGSTKIKDETGSQRLSIEKLQQWENLGYGMFIHFGMSTYDKDEFSRGDKPPSFYNPGKLDVDQWVSVARDAGMKYAVLTAKHVAGFCLWPSRYTNYHVGNSNNSTDVVERFVKACETKKVLPGLYYCSWDNHHLMGSLTPSMTGFSEAYTTAAYRDFQWKQLDELASQYGKIAEWWIDIPGILPRDYRNSQYNFLAEKHPDSLVVMNHGISDGSVYKVPYAWPSDVVTIERYLPNSVTKHIRWREIEGKKYYLPGEICEPIGKDWFFKEDDRPRSDEELLGMYLIARSRGTNLLLDVPPDKNGLIPATSILSLQQLRKNLNVLHM